MLTDQDIDRLLAVFATKQDLAGIRSDIKDLKESMQDVLFSCDSMAKAISELNFEYTGMKYQLNRHERWIPQIKEHVGLRLASD